MLKFEWWPSCEVYPSVLGIPIKSQLGLYITYVFLYTEVNKQKIKVKITNKNGGQYSYVSFDVSRNLSPEGSYLIAPKNAIFELKFPEVDIKGKVT